MKTTYIISALGLFGIVVLLFALVQLRLLARQRRRMEAARDTEGAQESANQASFRDGVMAMVEARLKEEALGMRLRPAEPISFKIGPAGGDEEAMLVVLLNLYGGCVEDPENAEVFKQHFLDDLIKTIKDRSW